SGQNASPSRQLPQLQLSFNHAPYLALTTTLPNPWSNFTSHSPAVSFGGRTNVPDDTIWPLLNVFPCSSSFLTNHCNDLNGLLNTSDDSPSFTFSPYLYRSA